MVKVVTVLGANGTMGCNVSAIFAAFGNAKVYMVGRSKEKVLEAVDKAAKSVRADAIKKNLIPADYSMLGYCISESDLIFESVAEDFQVKWEINQELAKYINEDQVICSGTSGLSIGRLAETLPEAIRKNYLGLHFYNPPYNLTLCELIPSKYTDRNILLKIKKYVTGKLYRTSVIVKDTPAFLGNRIGFQFINEALQYAEKYKDNGGIDYIDSILGQFSGRSVAPLLTSDFVGLDVHKAIVDNLYENTNDYARDTFMMPQFAVNLVNEGKLGRKSGEGFYKHELADDGKRKTLVYDIATDRYRVKHNYIFPFAENMISFFKVGNYKEGFRNLIENRSTEAELCLEFLLKYIIYSLSSTRLVSDNVHSADDVMATGFNWCPPLALIQAISSVDMVKSLTKERLSSQILGRDDLDFLFANVENSQYDYRRYFKARY